MRIDPYLPNTVERILVLEPHVVIIEMNGKNSKLVMENLNQNIPIIVLDEARRSFMVLAEENGPKAEISELAYVIENIVWQQDVLSGENTT